MPPARTGCQPPGGGSSPNTSTSVLPVPVLMRMPQVQHHCVTISSARCTCRRLVHGMDRSSAYISSLMVMPNSQTPVKTGSARIVRIRDSTKRLNSHGDSTSPCGTPMVMSNGSVTSPLMDSFAVRPAFHSRSSATIAGGTPARRSTSHNAAWSTES